MPSVRGVFATARLALARVPRWPRLLAALTCLLLAGLSAVDAHARRGPAAAGVPVLVSARSLPAGHRLAVGDLRVARWPSAVRPPTGYARASPLLGRRLAGPLGAGEALTPDRLVGASLTAGLPRGTAAVPVEIAQHGAADFVHPGDRIDLVAAPPDGADPGAGPGSAASSSAAASAAADTVAGNVRVLAVLPAGDTGTTTVVVATDQLTARRLARAGSTVPLLPVGESP